LIEEDFASRGWNAFDYASRYPGFTRVLQTAGRVIRSENDKGVVVLVDQRFEHGFYQQLYPDHWRPTICQTPDGTIDLNPAETHCQSSSVAHRFHISCE